MLLPGFFITAKASSVPSNLQQEFHNQTHTISWSQKWTTLGNSPHLRFKDYIENKP
jgi:hypothetical protein